MTGGQVFARGWTWSGWLVLAGGLSAFHSGPPWLGDRLIERTDPSLTAVWIDAEASLNADVERMIEEMEPLLTSPIERLGPGEGMPGEDLEVGLILMTGRNSTRWLETLGSTPTGRWVSDRLNEGSLVFAGAAAAAVLGTRVFYGLAEDQGCAGVGWLPGAVVAPGVPHPADDPHVRKYLSETYHSYALGLAEGTAMAIGPEGQIEVLAGEPPKIVLGRGWIAG